MDEMRQRGLLYQPAPAKQPPPLPADRTWEKDTDKVALRSALVLDKKGWCLWRITNPALAYAIIVRDDVDLTEDLRMRIIRYKAEITGNDDWPAFYTVSEMRATADMDDWTRQMVAVAKQHGAELVL